MKADNLFHFLVDFVDSLYLLLTQMEHLFVSNIPNIAFELILRVDGRKQTVPIQQHLCRIEITWIYLNWHLHIVNLVQKTQLHCYCLVSCSNFLHLQDQLLARCLQAVIQEPLCLSIAKRESVQRLTKMLFLQGQIVHDNFFDIEYRIYLFICRNCHFLDVFTNLLKAFVDRQHLMEAMLNFAKHTIGTQQFIFSLAKDGDSAIVLKTTDRVSGSNQHCVCIKCMGQFLSISFEFIFYVRVDEGLLLLRLLRAYTTRMALVLQRGNLTFVGGL